MKKILITIDDLGWTKSGIEAAKIVSAKNLVSGFGVIVNSKPYLLSEVKSNFEVGKLGLHINIFEGEFPIDNLGVLGSGGLARRLLREDEELGNEFECLTDEALHIIESEMKRQINFFEEFFGDKPNHLSYHFGIHNQPQIWEIYRNVAGLSGIPYRYMSKYSRDEAINDKHPLTTVDSLNHDGVEKKMVLMEINRMPEMSELMIHLGTDEMYKRHLSEIFEHEIELAEIGVVVADWNEI